MTTVRELVVEAVIAQLNTGTPAGIPATERTRLAAFQEDNAGLPAMTAFLTNEDPKLEGGDRGPLVRGTLTIGIECRAAGGGAVRPDQAVDPLLAWVVKALAGKRLSDGAGGYLSHVIKEGKTDWKYEPGANPICLATILVDVPYQHLTGDAERRS